MTRPDLATEPLGPGDMEVSEAGGVKVGDHVRMTEAAIARWRAGGVSDVACASARAGGTVVRIVRSSSGWWTTVVVRMKSPAVYRGGAGGKLHEGFGPEDLEHLDGEDGAA